MKRILIIQILFLVTYFMLAGQSAQQDLKREVTLYNPYKPSLPDFKKKSFLPFLDDTAKLRPDFKYEITTTPFVPQYTISPIKAVALQPDPLPELYKSYVKIGFGNYLSPLAELSITNERSKKGAVGFFARHYSANGKILLQNRQRVFAGFMDNDLSFFGKRFFRENFLEGSVDFSQKVRHAYGYDTSIVDYDPVKKETLMGYNNFGTDLSFASLTLDSTSFSYDFDVNYDLFYNVSTRYQHNFGVRGVMAQQYKGFYAGSGVEFDYYRPSDSLYHGFKYITSISPFIKKSNSQWNFKLGLQLLLDKNMTIKPEFHIYPDVNFGFSVVPSYVDFFVGLSGRLERNTPEKVILENPFIVRDGSLFTMKNTSHSLVAAAGLKGNTGIGGNYIVSASYSLIDNIYFYSNFVYPDSIFIPEMGNHFIPVADDAELLKLHGEVTGIINDKVSFSGAASYYKYTLSENEFAWGKPSWDGKLGIKYNLRDKIIAGLDITGTGERKLLATIVNEIPGSANSIIDMPVHLNFNLSAEYRYTKILSIWFKLNNISANRYYEWAYYPSYRFMGMVGFTYSL